MRERWARWIAALTGLLVLLIAAAFAQLQNPRPEQPPSAGTPPLVSVVADARVADGKRLFEALGCMRCHAVAGVGSPRSPLDDVATRRDAAALRDWIVADAGIRNQLSARALASKEDYAQLPAEQIDALVAYLQSLRNASTAPADR